MWTSLKSNSANFAIRIKDNYIQPGALQIIFSFKYLNMYQETLIMTHFKEGALK